MSRSARSTRTAATTPKAVPTPTPMATEGRTCALTGKALEGQPRVFLCGVNRRWPALWSAFQGIRSTIPGLEQFFESDDSLISRGTIDLTAIVLDADIKTVLEPLLKRLHASAQEDIRDHLLALKTKARELGSQARASGKGKKAPEIAEL